MSGYPGEYLGPAWSAPAARVTASGSGYVPGAADVCVAGRCHLTEGTERLATAGRLVEQLRREKNEMEQNAALWCDTGHAFSARDRGKKLLQVTVQDEETGQEVTDTRQVCGRCVITPAVVMEPVLWPPLAVVKGSEDGR